jgi:hypothetical protein
MRVRRERTNKRKSRVMPAEANHIRMHLDRLERESIPAALA